RLFTPDQFREMLGATATIRAVDAGFGVRGLIGTIDR
ncbi:MAG: methyltransferase type 11, partial [Sphingomonas sp.]|nr:methyltransferase type 11 [Sphingomonas sp.]